MTILGEIINFVKSVGNLTSSTIFQLDSFLEWHPTESGVKSKLGSLYSVFTPFSNNVCSDQLSLFCLAIVSIGDWMM